jgi:hypothetical protein
MRRGGSKGAALAAAAALSACTSLVSHVDPSDEPRADKAYVYARIEAFTTGPIFYGTPRRSSRVAISLACDGHESPMLIASEEQSIRLQEVTPATCALGSILVLDALGVPRHFMPIPNFDRKVHLQAGRAYYLRDIRVDTHVHWSFGDIFPPGDERLSGHGYSSERTIYRRYEQSTRDFVKVFPKFASMPTEDEF